MADRPITDDTARGLRTAWFGYLDAIEAIRAPLHGYCLKLTRDVWDAEDLAQDTLLRGFAMIGRGDLHGPGSPVENPKAYLFRTATHLWIDAQRRRARERAALAETPATRAAPAIEAPREAAEVLFAAASPQARAAVVLKDVFGFSLEEIADLLRTTVGGVKSALRRGREALARAPEAPPTPHAGPSAELVDRFIAAFRSQDVATITALLTETCSIEVPGVGGGRGRRGGWAEASIGHPDVRLERRLYRGEQVVLAFQARPDGAALYDVMRLEESDGLVSRLTNYCFCPDTLKVVAAELDLPLLLWGYHQPPEILPGMIATTTLPWGSGGLKLH
jgi:RNA polymerase sigma-70 factor, ECF subfamily